MVVNSLPTGYWLTRIRLYNWHAFDKPREIKLTFGKGLHVEGDTGVGKTTLMDAILWSLIGDENKIRFNASAGEHGSRSLKDYYRWLDQGTNSYRRDHGVAHTLLEFTHAETKETVTVGSLIDYDGENRTIIFLIAKLPLTLGLIMQPDSEGKGFRPLSVKQLRQVEKKRQEQGDYFRLVDTAKDYRDRLAQLFGNLNPHYFEVLNRVLGSEPKNLDVFIRSVLFAEEQLDPTELRERVVEMREAEGELSKAKDRLTVVRRIHDEHEEWKRKHALVLAYDSCEKQLKLDQVSDEIRSLELDQQRTSSEIGDLQQELEGHREQERETQQAYETALNNKNLNGINQQIQRLLEEEQRSRAEINQVEEQFKLSNATLASLRQWMDPLVDSLQALADISSQPISTAVPMIRSLANESQVDTSALGNHFGDLQAWLGGISIILEQQKSQHAKTIAEYSEALKQGRISDPYLKRVQLVQAKLSKIVGPPRLLYELVESVEPDWQGIVERLLGYRRFTLIPEPSQWEACQRAFRALPAEEADNLHLIQPTSVLRLNHNARSDSLASVVKTDDPLARGLLNMHLERYTRCDSDDEAVNATTAVVTRSGLVVSGGTIERRMPLAASHFIFGVTVREVRRKQMQAELSQLENLLVSLRGYSDQLGQLQKGIKREIEQLPKIQTDLAGMLEQRQEQHARLSVTIQELRATPNFLELEEKAVRARERNSEASQAVGKTQGQLKSKQSSMDAMTDQMTSLQNRRLTLEKDMTGLEENLAWKTTYSELRQLWDTWGTLIEKAKLDKARYESESGEKRKAMNERIDRFIEQHFPRALLDAEESKLKICLDEYENLNKTMQLDQLTSRVSKLRSEAEQILLRSFIDRLHRSHKSIESIMRDLNRTISVVPFARRRYKFVKEPVNIPLVNETLDLLRRYDDLQADRTGIDMTEQLRETHADLIDRLFRVLVPEGQVNTEGDQSARAVLTVPVKYFHFDLHASEDNGPEFSLSQHYTRGSGGERQLPVYIILAAAMRHFYSQESGQLHTQRPRLVLMDEAFNKAPIHAVEGLSLILEQGLQPLVSTPIGRPEVEEVIGHTKHVFIDEKSHQIFVDDISKNGYSQSNRFETVA